MPTGLSRATLFAPITLLLAACVTPPQVVDTYHDDAYAGSSFSNFLVIVVAGDYNTRAQFERSIVSGLKAHGVSASAFYSVAGGNKPVNSRAVLAAVESDGFDALLVTHVVDQQLEVDRARGAAGGKSTNIGGNPLDFFLYEYEELDEPESISLNETVVLRTELFVTKDEKMIWGAESSSSGQAYRGLIIDKIAVAIVDHLGRDGLTGNR